MLKQSSYIFIGLLLSSIAMNSSAVLPPKYLAIENFKLCVGSQEIDTYTALCMPAGKPENCPEASWEQLKALSGRDKIPDCPPVDAVLVTPSSVDKPAEK